MSGRKNEIFEAASMQHSQMQNPALTFEVPDIDVPLPSEGKVYPEGHPLAGKNSIVISAMTTAQENILTNKSLAKKGTLLNTFVQSCLKDKSINVKDMLIGDRNTIMVALRSSGYGADYKVGVTCPECSEKFTKEFQLDKLELQTLKINPIEKGRNLFELTLPQSKARVRFKFITGNDEEEIALTQVQKKKLGLSEGDVITTALMQSIVSINGISDKGQIGAALPRMPAFDSHTLRQYIKDNDPGIQLKEGMVCPSCDYTGEVSMPIGAGFFWPGAE